MTGRRVWDGTANYLILAGGGGGGSIIAGGGGAGGYRTSWGTGADGSGGYSGGNSSLETALTLSKGTAYSITVGQGGEGGFGWNSAASDANPHQGRDTSISGADITTITSDGGGGGSAYNHNTGAIKDGGSAGGGALGDNSSGTPTTGQGFSGGISGDTNAAGGGGGGAGEAGGNSNAGGSNTLAGTGGDGLASTITGTSVVRGGGGSGGARGAAGQYLGDYSTTPIPGGDGGGGVGGILNGRVPWVASGTDNASDGRAGYGGGGGGGAYTGLNASAINAGNGGSGIAIFRLPNTLSYSASQLASDVSSLSNCTASYLNTKVFTDDTNFDSVVLLMDGTSKTTDLSSENQKISETSTHTSLSNETDPFGNTQDVLDFSKADGTNGSGLVVSNAPIVFGNDPFTIEMFIKLDTTDGTHLNHTLYSDRDASNTIIMFRVHKTGQLQFFKDNVGGGSFTGSSTLTTGTWYHVALTYDGSTLRMFVDGNLDGSSNQTLTFNSSANPVLGYDPEFPDTVHQLDGRMAQVRITKGVARYTSAFTAPTAAFPNRETSTGGDHVISFTVATEDPYDGATANDGSCVWTIS